MNLNPVTSVMAPAVTSLMISLLAVTSFHAFADEVLVVTASGYDKKITDAAASVSVISQQDLAKNKFTDLGDALRAIEGVDVESGTGKTGGLDISIRGMPASYTLILIDGIRQNGSRDVTPNGFGAMNTSFMPPLSAIERIEVIRGPMSTLYGSDAIGGVVNIITKTNNQRWGLSVNSGLNVHENKKWGNSGNVNFWTSGPLVHDLLSVQLRGSFLSREGSSVTSLSPSRSTRTPYPTASQNYSAGLRLNLSASDAHQLWLDLDSARQRYQNDDGQLGNLTGGYDKTLYYQRQKITLGHRSSLGLGTLKSTLSWNDTVNTGRQLVAMSLTPEQAGLAGQPRKLNNTNIILDTLFLAPLGEKHLLTIGGEYWDAKMKDGVVLASTGKTFHQTSWSVYAEDEWRLFNPLALTYGTRYEQHQVFGGHLSPRAYLVWNVDEAWTIKGGLTSGYKAPSLSQLHNGVSGVTRQGQINIVGNSDLKPEKSFSYELGLYYDHHDGLNANITGFYTDYRNKIVSYALNDTTNSYVNSGKARTAGIEFASVIPLWSDKWDLTLNYTFTHSQLQDGEDKGAALSHTPKHIVNARINWQASSRLQSWLSVRYRGAAPRFTQNYANLSAVQKQIYHDRGANLKAWTVLDLGASYKLTSNLTVNAAVNNLLGKDFSEVKLYQAGRSSSYAGAYFQTAASTTGYVIPERNYWLSLNYQF